MTTPTKDTSRNDRLSISYSHKAEHVLRQELGQRALRRCDGDLKAFAECAKEQVRVCGNEGGLVGGVKVGRWVKVRVRGTRRVGSVQKKNRNIP